MLAELAQKHPAQRRRLGGVDVPFVVGEFWTAAQRQACALHEVSYRACFKPQLPAFFIERLSKPGDVVYDPFLGRGTTAIEAALRGRVPFGNDVNPLSALLTRPRLESPDPAAVERRLDGLRLSSRVRCNVDLSMFFERKTLSHIVSLKNYLAERAASGKEDACDRWIRMTATNRLTGHSSGFFSVYTLPPNQAASAREQRRINARLGQRPEFRDIKTLIMRKTLSMTAGLCAEQIGRLRRAAETARFFEGDASRTQAIAPGRVALTVTSPPFLDVVSYAKDNWLRCWFNGIDAEAVGRRITMARTVETWESVMARTLRELFRITRRGGFVAFEVGEVRKGRVKLEESVVPLGAAAGFSPVCVLINEQRFTKTSNIWGVANNARGTNTNRIAVFQRPL